MVRNCAFELVVALHNRVSLSYGVSFVFGATPVGRTWEVRAMAHELEKKANKAYEQSKQEWSELSTDMQVYPVIFVCVVTSTRTSQLTVLFVCGRAGLYF